MLSLILTALLGLFCYSGSIDNRIITCSSDCSPSSKSALNNDTERRYLYAMDEVFNAYNIENYYNWYPQFFDNGYTGNVVSYGDSTSTGVIDNWANLNFSTLDASAAAFTFDSIQLSITAVGYTSSYDYAGYYRRIELRFLNTYTSQTFGKVYTFDYFNGSSRGGVNSFGTILNQSMVANMVDYGVLIHRDLSTFFSDLFNPVSLDYNSGYNDGYSSGYSIGYNAGESTGYQNGYTAGYNEAASTDATASTIFTGILDVSLVPVNVFLTIFNFEVFGINIAGIVSGLLTLSIVIIIFRFLFGGKSDD